MSPVLSRHALASLARALSRPLALWGSALDPKLRERVILRVSSVNSCAVCSAIHGPKARVGGMTDAEIAAARSGEADALDERTRLALRYAELRTAALERDFPEDVAAFEGAFSAREREAVRAVVDLFTFNNRFNNTWEALLPGARARRRALGLE